MKSRNILILLLIVYIAVIIFFAVTPEPKKFEPLKISDRAYHFIEFFIFSLLLYATLVSFKVKYAEVWVIIIGIAMGIFSEIIQLYVPRRFFDWFDYVADIFGIITGLFTGMIAKWKFHKR